MSDPQISLEFVSASGRLSAPLTTDLPSCQRTRPNQPAARSGGVPFSLIGLTQSPSVFRAARKQAFRGPYSLAEP
jgi:hypothetical protein